MSRNRGPGKPTIQRAEPTESLAGITKQIKANPRPEDTSKAGAAKLPRKHKNENSISSWSIFDSWTLSELSTDRDHSRYQHTLLNGFILSLYMYVLSHPN